MGLFGRKNDNELVVELPPGVREAEPDVEAATASTSAPGPPRRTEPEPAPNVGGGSVIHVDEEAVRYGRSASEPAPKPQEDARPAQMDTLDPSELRSFKRLKSLVRVMDTAVAVPFTKYRFGADAVLGLIPYAGDAAGAVIGTYIVSRALKYHLPKRLVMRMAVNQAIDSCVGVVPFIGDIFDVTFKANHRNLLLLEEHLQQPAKAKRADTCFLCSLFFGVIVLPLSLVVGIIGAIIVGILAATHKL